MVWQIEFDPAAVKELARLDKPVARRIVAFLRERIATAEDPRTLGEALRGADFQSVNVRGLFPAGEGAGYAGGIMSAGVDGIEVAEAVARAMLER